MSANPQYRQLLNQLSADKYTDMSRAPTAVTIALEDMEFEGLIEPRESGSLEYRLTAKGIQMRDELK
jgi:hypothetical protein